MKSSRLFPSFLLAAVFAVVFLTAARADDTESSTIKFSDPAKPGTLRVSVANGDLRIRGADTAEVTVTTDLKAETSAPRKDGLRVLTTSSSYSLTEKNNTVSLTYGADSWPTGGGGDFAITVPHSTAIIVSNSLGGDIQISGVTGDIEIKCLNGEVKLNDLTGGALVETMNGEIVATVRELRDGKPLSFTSMNGEIALKLPAAAKAKVRLRTHNGSILTDFDDKTLVTKTESVRVKGARAPRAVSVGSNNAQSEEIRAAVHAAVRSAAEAAREVAAATREAARAAREAAREETEAPEAPEAPESPVPPVPPLPPMTGGKIVTGTLNGGGDGAPEIRITTMNGDITLRQIEPKK